MDQVLFVTASPHIRDDSSTRGLMGNVLKALVPCIVAAALIFGYEALISVAVTTLACVAFEYLYCLIMKKPNPVGDLSACVTGVILALNFPVGLPLWICVVGAFVAIVVVKQLFGGIGFNFANPALVGRIVLFLSFTARMTAYIYPDMAVDALASATPLADSVDKTTVSLLDLFLGLHGGMMGETCILAILLGLVYLLATGTIGFAIPGSIVGTVFVLSWIATGSLHAAVAEILAGGLMFGAVFMATDYVTSPFTTKGKLIYGIFIGLVTFAIRYFGSMNEGMSFAILLGNLMVPWFNAWSHQIPLGYKKPKKQKKAAKAAAKEGGNA
ncbi:RnfABCDGE type electron transport complex subunit D [uncultured Gemmiger sp.]|uniref:RnfABCDGE type electron transport complex subunit D n=1 Tax=uncultured Gemmiger sp. TaxID=1623490 RepID=UPI0025E8AB2A|nr:RnfABCDGE type electron transport complex subunit D [uncultured Gemmiger sp.]